MLLHIFNINQPVLFDHIHTAYRYALAGYPCKRNKYSNGAFIRTVPYHISLHHIAVWSYSEAGVQHPCGLLEL